MSKDKKTQEELPVNENVDENENVDGNENENVDRNENVDGNGNAAGGAEEPKELTLEEKLAESEALVEQLKKEALYKVAEFENYRKRVIKEKADLITMGGKNLMLALLPVIDDLDRAEEHIAKSEDVEALKEGLLLISQKLRTTLQQQGLEAIEAKGEKFDTDLHEAVTMFPVEDEKQKGCVIDCVQQGYKLNGNVIRHSKVVVGQ